MVADCAIYLKQVNHSKVLSTIVYKYSEHKCGRNGILRGDIPKPCISYTIFIQIYSEGKTKPDALTHK